MERRALLGALVLCAGSGCENQARASDAAVLAKIHLDYLAPAEGLSLLLREAPAEKSDELHGPQSLVPSGVEMLIGFPPDNSLLVRGRPSEIALLRAALTIVDRPKVRHSRERVLARLEPCSAPARLVAVAMRRLLDAGAVAVQTGVVELEGSEEWVRRALRLAMEMEMEALRLGGESGDR